MKYRILAMSVLALGGCEELEPEPQAPSLDFQVMMQACENGNLDACNAVSDMNAKARADRMAALKARVAGHSDRRPGRIVEIWD